MSVLIAAVCLLGTPQRLTPANYPEMLSRVKATPTVAGMHRTDKVILVPGDSVEFYPIDATGLGITDEVRKINDQGVYWIFSYYFAGRLSGLRASRESVQNLAVKIYREIRDDTVRIEPFGAVEFARNLDWLRDNGLKLGRNFTRQFGYSGLAKDLEDRSAEFFIQTQPLLVAGVKNVSRKPGSLKVLESYAPSDVVWQQVFERETGLKVRATKNRFEIGQCTWLAYSVRDDFPFDPKGQGRNDARNWLARAKEQGLRVGEFVPGQNSPAPETGAILVHRDWPGNSFGHVSIVGEINADGTLVVWDCNFAHPTDGLVRKRLINLDDYVAGYIYPPSEYQPQHKGVIGLSTEPVIFGDNYLNLGIEAKCYARSFQLDPNLPGDTQVTIKVRLACQQGQRLTLKLWPVATKEVAISPGTTTSQEIGPVRLDQLRNRTVLLLAHMDPVERDLTASTIQSVEAVVKEPR